PCRERSIEGGGSSMPTVCGNSRVARRWRLSTLLTGITLVGRSAGADSTLARPPVRSAHANVTRGSTRFIPSGWPVRGAVTSPFGWRRSPYGGNPEWHAGVDIEAPSGVPVLATADGEVIFAGRVRGYGALVILDHGVATTRYAHLAAITCPVGRRVRRGDTIGLVGGTGRATGPHLHYEVRVGNEAFDPVCLSRPRPSMSRGTRDRPVRSCAPASR